MFNIGDLVKLRYADHDDPHYGIVIDKSDRSLTDRPVYSYYIRWAFGEQTTWEIAHHLALAGGANV